MALFKRENVERLFGGVSLISVQVCWNCRYLQGIVGRYSSKGPKCAECGEHLDTYKVVG